MASNTEFPCVLDIHIPFPSGRHAAIALRALSVDPELSQFVRRSFSVKVPARSSSFDTNGNGASRENGARVDEASENSVLRVLYSATTPRMLRVATNGFFESLGVVLGAMEELDTDVLALPGKESVAGAQGLEALDGEV
ncbi:Pcc1-domain-containing protein [Rhizodiscina lignyota]|uniref:Pcc1-domain-containing protein n=1 Tax=Rhizodiscina lignyota TaxID=1504668 RepID=A0A9P4IMA4_9PEZI|nr:Pcc1-domain-containing protein [Rhizodiscina lignyota]